jgi:ribosomal protein S18 acetylase RimI-like enzyme
VEPLTLAVHLATTDSVDAQELAAVAACTFPLACPPSTPAENIASFIDTNLSPARFAEYLSDPQRAILTARQDGRIIGYAMLIRGISEDADVQRAVEIHPAAELSKLYLLPDYHGKGVSTALMDTTLATAAEWGVHSVWLGVNQGNQRAQRFYVKSGFKVNGTRTFQVGARREDDYVMVRELRSPGGQRHQP